MQGRVHIWDSGNIIADIGTETVYYIRVLTLIYAKKGETKTYYRFNGHGDVIALANSSGAIIKRYKYDSFGVEENPGIFDTNVFRYCGEYYDIETKTIYLRARYYDAETGRFTQQDGWSYAVPGFLLSLNLYTYCGNDPVSHVDPSGHFLKKAFNKVKNAVSSVVSKAKSAVSSVKKHISNTVRNIVNEGKAALGYLHDTGNSVISYLNGETSKSELKSSFVESTKEFADATVDNFVNQASSSADMTASITSVATAVAENTSPIFDYVTEAIKEMHYNRNDNQPIESLPQTQEEAEELVSQGLWRKMEASESLCHQYTAGDAGSNVKYMSSDGHFEVIYDANGAMVIAPEDAGSYNLSPPDGLIGKAGHFLVDMLPWYLWGNAPNDSTTIGERIFVPIGLAVKSLWR